MLIVCNGMLRSGSTLQYNMVRLLVAAAGKGQGEGFLKEKDLPNDLLKDWEKGEKLHVIKSHALNSDWLRGGHAGRIKFCYIFRDIRDVAVSVKIKFGCTGDRLLTSLDRAVEFFNLMKNLQDVLWQRYEEVTFDMTGALRTQASFLGLNVNESVIGQIVEKCQVKAATEITESLQGKLSRMARFLRTIKLSGAQYDKETLLHPDHISKNKGMVGVWKKDLAPEEINILNSRYEKWLREQGYLLTPYL